jgi:hypothetical protein
MQHGDGRESLDSRPVHRQAILVRADLDQKAPGLVDDLAEVQSVLGQ